MPESQAMLKPFAGTTPMGEKVPPGNKEVMGALRQKRGVAPPAQPGKQMSPVQIVQDVMQKSGEDPSTAQEFLRNCDKLVSMNLAQSVQIGNTLFLLLKMDERGQPLPQGTANMMPFTAEEEAIEQRLRVLPNTLRQLGFRKVTLRTNDQADIAAMQRAGLQPKVRQEMTFTGQQMTPMYAIELEV
jgi:hypothetical protein